MLTRRRFGQALGAAAVVSTARPRAARAAIATMRFGNASGTIDAQGAFITVGAHPKLGWHQQEGVAVDFVNTSGVSQSLQALATHACEFASMTPTAYLPLIAKNPTLDMVSAYVFMPQPHYAVGVKPDSDAKAIADLRGKTIGIRNTGDSGYFALRAMLVEAGIDPNKEVEYVSVNGGGPAGQALYSGKIAAIAIWDAELARIELAGFKLRFLPNTPGVQHLFGSTFGVARTALKKDPQPYIGLFRAMAKGAIFTYANPALAVRLHWQLYPESKPKTKNEQEALDDMLYLLRMRMPKWFPAPEQPDQRMGASSLEQWQAQIRFTALQDPEIPKRIPDPAALFTNELIDEVNRFDRAAVIEQAKTLTL
jgi:NitT/TauT family transport system substrate-binding protein